MRGKEKFMTLLVFPIWNYQQTSQLCIAPIEGMQTSEYWVGAPAIDDCRNKSYGDGTTALASFEKALSVPAPSTAVTT
jgi:hypothetical protein